MRRAKSIVYFENEGKANLREVLRSLQSNLRKRPEMRDYKIVFFTAIGEGPAKAYDMLARFDPKIIAVTFPPYFSVMRGEERIYPKISPKLVAFFNGVGIEVVSTRLPFEHMDGADAHNNEVDLIRKVLNLFGGGFSQLVQAVLQACDCGKIQNGERVIAVSGDCAAIITASNTKTFLQKDAGLVINEILCKPNNLTIVRSVRQGSQTTGELLFDDNAKTLNVSLPMKLLPEKKQ